jgi:hypothetical protein
MVGADLQGSLEPAIELLRCLSEGRQGEPVDVSTKVQPLLIPKTAMGLSALIL